MVTFLDLSKKMYLKNFMLFISPILKYLNFMWNRFFSLAEVKNKPF